MHTNTCMMKPPPSHSSVLGITPFPSQIITICVVQWICMGAFITTSCFAGLPCLQVAAWADRKERNIRAIISSFHEILWEGETKWEKVGMHQLVQPDQV